MPNDAGKVKFYKNPDRGKSKFAPYIPQYQVEGKEPLQHHKMLVPSNTPIAGPSTINPRLKREHAMQIPLPAENDWIGIEDDMSGIDPNHPMVDNNEFLTDEAMGFRSGVTANELTENPNKGTVIIEQGNMPSNTVEDVSNLIDILRELDEDSYLLIVADVPLCFGPKEEIQEQAQALAYGEHEMCEGNPIPVDDIMIIRRSKIKVGLFLE